MIIEQIESLKSEYASDDWNNAISEAIKLLRCTAAAPRADEPSNAGLVEQVARAIYHVTPDDMENERLCEDFAKAAIPIAQAPLLERIKELEFNLRECTAHADLGWSKYDAAHQEIERLRRALGMAETEMRYAGWSEYDSENVGRVEAYKAAQQALRDKAGA